MSEDGLEALFDRFLLKYMIRPIQEKSNFKQMIMNDISDPETTLTLDELYKARDAVKKVEVNEGMADILIELKDILKRSGIHATDRTYKTAMRIVKAQAFCRGRDSVIEDDFDVLRHVLWTQPEDERTVWSLILDKISPEKGKILSLYEEAVEVAEKAINEKDERKRLERGVDSTNKLKDVRIKIGKYIKQLEKKNKDTEEAKKYDNKVKDLLSKVFVQACRMGDEDIFKGMMGEK